MGANPGIIWMSFGVVVSIALFNSFGIAVTKYASAAQRSTIDTSRTVLIWMMSCLLGLETFQWRTIPGFIMLVFGTLLYNEIIVLPCGGFDLYTKEALAKNKKIDPEEEVGYMATSPQAAYDASRNKRALKVKESMASRRQEEEIEEDDQQQYLMNTADDR